MTKILSVAITVLVSAAACQIEPQDSADVQADAANLDAAYAVVETAKLDAYVIEIDGEIVDTQPEPRPHEGVDALATELPETALVDCVDGCCYWINSFGPGQTVCCSTGTGPAQCHQY